MADKNNYDYDEVEEQEELEDLEEDKSQKKKRFNLFDWFYRDSKKKDQPQIDYLKRPSIGNFFKLLGSNFSKMLTINVLFVFSNIPIIFVIIAMTGYLSPTVSVPLNQEFSILKGTMLFEELNGPASTAATSVLLGLYGAKVTRRVFNTITIVFYCLGALCAFTFGFSKVGTMYLYRNMLLGEPVFVFSDFFYIIKRNIKQSLIFGIFDFALIAMFAYNLYYLFVNYNVSQMNSIMFFFTIVVAIFYSFMRNYIYLMIFTFKLSLWKIIKNATYFILLGLKRNVVALLFQVVIILMNIGLFLLLAPVGAILPFALTFAILDFAAVYAAYPNIDKYMVDHSES